MYQINARAVSAADTLRLTFTPANVVAKFKQQTATAPYGMPVQLAELSFVVPAKPPVESAKYYVVTREQAIAQTGGVEVKGRTDTNIADFSLNAPDPVLAVRELNAMTIALASISQQADQTSARARRRFLDDQLRRTDSILETQRAQISAFRARTQTFDAVERGAQEQQNIANLRARREELAADRDVFASLLPPAIQARKEGDPSKLRSLIGAPGITSNSIIAELYSRIQKLSLAKDSLTSGPFASASSNPDVQRIDAQIESATDEFISAVQSNIATYDARIKALDALANRTAQEASGLPQTQSEQERLQQDLESTQRLSDQLHDEQQRARISEVAQGGKVEIIDLATAQAVTKSGTRKLVLGGLLGVAIALGLIFLYDELNTSLRRKDEVERLLLLPTLGSIPALTRHTPTVSRKLLGKVSGNGSKSNLPVTQSQVFESYRAIRTSLIFSHAVESLRTVAITSASPGDGKSTTIANLAIAFAQQNLKVLVIDCDLRRGSLHRIFGIPRTPGLTNAVATGADIESVIRETSTPNLSIITCGVQPPNPGELLGSHRVTEILLRAQTQYDLVLIDTPPVLAAADAGIIASMVDGVILLVRVGVTTKSAAKTAQERLKIVGARILGTVLNDPKEMLEATEEYYYYDYSSSSS
jgi:capsular exopolysaccharide synthesis family protein